MIPVPLAAACKQHELESSAGQASARYSESDMDNFVNARADVAMSAETCASRSPPDGPTNASLDALIGDWISSESDGCDEGEDNELKSGSDSGCVLGHDVARDSSLTTPALDICFLREGGATHEPDVGVASASQASPFGIQYGVCSQEADFGYPADGCGLILKDSGSFSARRPSNTCSTAPGAGNAATSDPLPTFRAAGPAPAAACKSAESVSARAGPNSALTRGTTISTLRDWAAFTALGWPTATAAPTSPWGPYTVQQVPALNSIAAAAAATHLAPMTSGALGPVPAPISAPLFKASSHVHASCPGAFPGASNRGCQSMPPGDGMQIFLTVDSGRPWGVQCLPQEGPATAHTAAAAGGDSQRPLVAKGRVLGNSAAVAAAVAQQRELGFGLNEPTHLGSGMRSSSREQDEEGTGCLVQQAIRHQQQHHQSGGRLRGAHGDAYDGDNFAQQMVHLHQNAWREEVAAAPDVGPLVIGEPWQAFEPGHGTSASSVAVAAGATAVLPGSAGGGGNAQDPRAITSVPSQMAFSAAHTSSLPDRSDLREQREQPIWDPLGAPRCHHCQQQVQQQQQQQRLRQLRELEEQCQAGQHQHMQMQQALLDLNLHRKQGSFGPPISQQLQQQLQHQLQPQQLPGLLTIQELLDPLPGLQQQEQQQLTWQGLLGPGQQQEGAGSFHAHAPAAQASSPPPRLFASGSSGCAAMAAAAAAGAGAGTAGAATGVHSQPLASLCQGYCRSQPYGLCRSVSGFPTSGGFSGDGGGGDGGGEEAFADIISEDVMEVSNPAVTTARHPYQGICLAPMSTAVGARDRTALRFSDHGIVHDIRGRGRGDVAAGGGSGATKRGRIELLFRSVDGSRDRDRDRES